MKRQKIISYPFKRGGYFLSLKNLYIVYKVNFYTIYSGKEEMYD